MGDADDTSASSTSSSSTSSSSSSSEGSKKQRRSGKRRRDVKQLIAQHFETLTDEIANTAKKQKTAGDFKYRSNAEQFLFNEEIVELLRKANRRMKRKDRVFLDKPMESLTKRNELIEMADKSAAGWRLLEEYRHYEREAIKPESKLMKKAEQRALKKLKEERKAREGGKRFRNVPPSTQAGAPSLQRGFVRRGPRPTDRCFRCGKTGHWSETCPTYGKKEAYGPVAEYQHHNERYGNQQS